MSNPPSGGVTGNAIVPDVTDDISDCASSAPSSFRLFRAMVRGAMPRSVVPPDLQESTGLIPNNLNPAPVSERNLARSNDRIARVISRLRLRRSPHYGHEILSLLVPVNARLRVKPPTNARPPFFKIHHATLQSPSGPPARAPATPRPSMTSRPAVTQPSRRPGGPPGAPGGPL